VNESRAAGSGSEDGHHCATYAARLAKLRNLFLRRRCWGFL